MRSKVVVDASGYFGMVRKQLPAEMGIDRDIANQDVEACYREIRQLKQETENTTFLRNLPQPKSLTWRLHLDFPQRRRTSKRWHRHFMRENYPNPKQQLYETAFKKPMFEGSLVLTGGSWFDPVRRPLDNMVSNGVVLSRRRSFTG